MRALQLRAIAVLCPLKGALTASTLVLLLGGLGALGCERIVQPVGQYEATPQKVTTATPPQHEPAAGGPAPTQPDATLRKDAGTPLEAGTSVIDGGNVAWPPVFNEATPDAATPSMPAPSCTPTTTYPADRRRVDMYLLLDANITLPYTGLWEFVTAGIRAFVTDRRSQGIGVGLRTFGLECDADAYDLSPTVEVDVLPDNESTITSATQARYNFNASPMHPALAGGIHHQRRRATLHPEWKQIVVLLSDGFTQDFSCVYTEADLESDASTGFIGPPSIETHVIGFGFPGMNNVASDIVARFSSLDSIAHAGGTAQSVQVGLGTDPSTMNEALQSVRRTAQPCEYVLPNNLDPNQLSLVLTPGGELPRVVADTSCGRLPGWYFDDAKAPQSMKLCPVSCQTIQKDDSHTAVLVYGCPALRR